MDPRRNPFAPGAGTRPPELAGREAITEAAAVALERIKRGRPARGQFLIGLRGVGKTVLLNHLAELAQGLDYQVLFIESPESGTLAELLVPELRKALFALSRVEAAKDYARRGLSVLRAFAHVFKVRFGELELELDPEPGVADSGQVENDLPDLLMVVAQAAKAAGRAVGLFIDEVQYLPEPELGALLASAHRLGQRGLPFLLFGAGLPQLPALAGDAKSYAERLLEFPKVDRLDTQAAAQAIAKPIADEGAHIDAAALEFIVQQTRGYPYFLQEWGKHAWDAAAGPEISEQEVRTASARVLKALDESFFRVRLERLTPRELDYVRAMASLGPGPQRSSAVAKALLLKASTAAGPLRDAVMKKGMIYSPRHGDIEFTVPMFDDFMLRSMPDWRPGDRG